MSTRTRARGDGSIQAAIAAIPTMAEARARPRPKGFRAPRLLPPLCLSRATSASCQTAADARAPTATADQLKNVAYN